MRRPARPAGALPLDIRMPESRKSGRSSQGARSRVKSGEVRLYRAAWVHERGGI
jgi:hypothetical protein